MEQLHKGVKWRFRFQAYFFIIFLLIFFGFPFWINKATNASDEIPMAFSLVFSSYFIWIILIAYIVIAEFFIHLAYKNWKYEFTKEAIKIESGVIIKKYKSIPYERVQNVDIVRGILARIIGFSTLEIQTAGYSIYTGKNGMGLSEGHLPAVSKEKAEEIRDFLMKRISGKKQGL